MFEKLKFWKAYEEINPSADPLETASLEGDEDNGQEITKEIDTDDVTTYTYPGADSVHDYLAAPVSTSKVTRLNEYRVMSNHVEVCDAIDEIADGVYNVDDQGCFAKLQYTDDKFNDDRKDILNKEFKRFIQMYNFEENTFNYIRQYVIEGELVFENIIDPKEPTKGILSVKLLENDKFELLKDLKTNQIIGIYFDVSKEDVDTVLHASYGGNHPYFKEIDVNGASGAYGNAMNDNKKIPLLFSQLTYIHTGVFDKNKTFVYPPLDKSRQAYRQLVLIEDGVIIYRVARSPERLVFNIASGNTSGAKAQQQLLQMVKRFNTRKATKNGTDGSRGITNMYDSHQVVESFWFLKPSDSEGSSVENIGGSSDFGELEDLKFFTRKLYRSLKVPFSRTEQPENSINKSDDVSYEEYKFSKFITRINLAIASGLFESFKTHLKLRQLWSKYKMNNYDLRVGITPPALFDLYQTTKLQEIKMDNYEKIADNENFSWTLAMKKILNMTDEEIQENIDALKKEAYLEAELEYWKEQIGEHGSFEKAKKVLDAEENNNTEDGDEE